MHRPAIIDRLFHLGGARDGNDGFPIEVDHPVQCHLGIVRNRSQNGRYARYGQGHRTCRRRLCSDAGGSVRRDRERVDLPIGKAGHGVRRSGDMLDIRSVLIDDVIVDISEDGFMMAIEILDASRKFNVQKSDLSNVQYFNAEIRINEETIKITMELKILKRNGLINKSIEAIGINDMNLPVSTQEIALSC